MAEKKYKNAFKCHKCPQSNGEDGCPAWNEVIMTEAQSGEQKIVKGCNFQLMPWIMTEAIKAANVSTGTSADIKNEVAKGFALVASAVPGLVEQLAANIADDAKQLEPGDKE